MTKLQLGVRLSPGEFRRLHMESIDFESKIDNLKILISDKISIPMDSMELVYCGNILEDDMTLKACGLKPGVMVHVLKKKAKEMPIPSQPMSEQDIKALVIAFRTLTLNPSHRNSLQKLSRPDILENIIMITPGLSQDPVAISLIQDPELMVRLANFDTVRRIVELHPALAEAANHIAATVHEEAIQIHTTGPSTSATYGLLDLLSDDDDMESSQESDDSFQNLASRLSRTTNFNPFGPFNELDDELDYSDESSDSVQPGVSRNSSFSAITSAQLAAALASARESGGSRSNPDAGGSAITPEMVSEAMQRAMASVVPGASALARTPSEEGATSNNDGSNLQEQMRQMRELGLTDDAVNLQALQLAAGNVHAAVDLVFSGAINPDTTM